MSDKQAVRDALAGGAMTFAELEAKTGLEREKLRRAIDNLRMDGDVSCMGRGAQKSVALKNGKGGQPRKKAVKRRKAKRATRPYKRIADRVAAAAPANGNGVLERQHVRTTLAALESVIDLGDADPHVAAAFASHKEAIELLSAHG